MYPKTRVVTFISQGEASHLREVLESLQADDAVGLQSGYDNLVLLHKPGVAGNTLACLAVYECLQSLHKHTHTVESVAALTIAGSWLKD